MAFSNNDLSWSEVKDLFRKWREDNERKSSRVVQLWESTLEDKVQKLGNERHLVLEQVIIAAFDCGRVEIAEDCIQTLSGEFPGSLRVLKYRAMQFEARERFDKALELLEFIISKDETNAAPRKRKIAILKAQRKTQEAIKELCDYLKLFMSDQEAWHELCNLYLAESEYAKAAFCMEEVLLCNPHSHLIHQRLAEIRYTMGGLENIEIAKTYYLQALKLNEKSLRALYGVYLCCTHIANSKASVNKRKDSQKIGNWALTQIAAITEECVEKEKQKSSVSALEKAFGSLDIKIN